MTPEERIKAINDERLKVANEQKTLLESIKPGETRTAEQVAELARQDDVLSEFDSQIEQIRGNDNRERIAAQMRENDAYLYGTDEPPLDRSVEEGFKSWVAHAAAKQHLPDLQVDISTAMKEREMLRQGADWTEIKNALLTDTGSIASAVPTTMARTLVEYMEASIAAFRVGAQVINTASGENMDFPQVATHGIATQVSGQGTVVAGTDPVFDKLTLGANRYGQIVVVSNDAVTDTVFDIGSFLGQNIGRALGRIVDQHLINGTGSITHGLVGSGVTPSGAALGSVFTGGSLASTVGLDPTWLIDAVHGVVDEYRNTGAGWLFNDSAAADIRKIRDGAGGTEGAFLWEPSRTRGLVGGQPDTLLGFPVYTDPNIASIASNNVIGNFGDHSTYYIRQAGNVQIESSTERYFDTDQVGFRGKIRIDGGYADTAGVVQIINLTT